MRHIRIEDLPDHIPSGWDKRAASAQEKVSAASHEDRSDRIKSQQGIWRELAVPLGQLSHRKCWYCEARENRSDLAVDHFRPKGRVAECAAHPGYWWLAFQWENYRYSCTFCNSYRRDRSTGEVQGKQDHFPILDETKRAFEAAHVAQESPELLDPVCYADTLLLYFREDGHAQPRARKDSHPVQHRRARTSIDLYHLNHETIVEARIELFQTVKRLIDLGRQFFDDWNAGNMSAKLGFDHVVSRLRTLVEDRAEFSSAARDMLKGFRDDRHVWVDAIL